jgi:hypothetical protein
MSSSSHAAAPVQSGMRARTAFVLSAAAATTVFFAQRHCPLSTGWVGPAPYYDYLRAITFERGGRGHFFYGYAQHVECKFGFTWTRQGDEIDLLSSSVAPAGTMRIRIDSGNFVVPVNDYPKPTPRRFGCRLTFERNPYPHCGDGREFYSCPLD